LDRRFKEIHSLSPTHYFRHRVQVLTDIEIVAQLIGDQLRLDLQFVRQCGVRPPGIITPHEISERYGERRECGCTELEPCFCWSPRDSRIQAERTLHVSTILEGSVRESGNRLRVTAHLINAADGYHLWSQRYDRELADVFAMQDEIAAAIASELQLKLIEKQSGRHTLQPNLRAYEAFLRGRYLVFANSVESIAEAREAFEQAIALDPEYSENLCRVGDMAFCSSRGLGAPRSGKDAGGTRIRLESSGTHSGRTARACGARWHSSPL
jgi:hypothetical protein